MKSTIETDWYESGQKRLEGNSKDGKKEGVWIEFYENGQKSAEGSYKNDKRDGLWTCWDGNGHKIYEVSYKNDEKDGLRTKWYENGQKELEGNWNGGKRDGFLIWWYENGQKESKKSYKNDKLDGLWTEWYKNGQKKFETNYNKGKLDGPCVKWDEDASFDKSEKFNDGEVEDKVVIKLKSFTDYDGNFSYDDIRKIALKEVDILIKDEVHGELGRGRSILKTHDQLNQYWWSYALIIKSQLDYVFKYFDSFVESYEFVENKLEIIDYGCGQGGASIRFLDKFHKDFKTYISKIKLIEPSPLALQRARGILECYSSDMQIVAINKELDYVTHKELETDINRTYIHLFSNILDVKGFDLNELFSKIVQIQGCHFFIAVSIDRSFSGGTRIRDIYESLIDPIHVDNWTIVNNKIETFPYRTGKSAIFFIINLEVLG